MKSGSLGALLTLVALAAVGASCGPGSARAPSAADAPHPSGPSRTCDGCHPAIAAEWSASFHRTAFVDETFQRSLALEEPREHAFCTRCHAPGAERAGAGVAVGVDCVDCHGASPHEPPRHGAAASAVKAASSASPFAEVACPHCHMPAKDGHQDHRFLSGHAPDRLGAAVHVEVARHGADALDVAIRVDAGHAFPTGDMFRRARLLVFAEGARAEIVQSAERIFGRTWGGVAGGQHAGGAHAVERHSHPRCVARGDRARRAVRSHRADPLVDRLRARRRRARPARDAGLERHHRRG